MKGNYTFRTLSRILRLSCSIGLLAAGTAQAQQVPAAGDTAQLRRVALEEITVAPGAVNSKEWLLLNPDIQTELEGAVNNLYNFKYDKAEKQFRSLRRRYPDHPMPYFLLGLNTWWKIMPSNTLNKQYDKPFFAYMDTAIVKAERLYNADNENYEASFFLAAAYGFDARLHAERRDWTKATLSSKRSLSYLQKSREANGLSPEFTFGEALFNYYSVWIAEEYPFLRPVLLFFPKGDRKKGLAQLESVAQNGFYTGIEARSFQMRIMASEREHNMAQAIQTSRKLVQDFPDNACFARAYANHAFIEGRMAECEQTSRDILEKINKGLPGYESVSGRLAAYYLGYLMQNRYRDFNKAKDYYQRCLVYSESLGQTKAGYYLFSLSNLGRIAAAQKNVTEACRYFEQVEQRASRKSEMYKEAHAYLRQNAQASRRSGRPDSQMALGQK